MSRREKILALRARAPAILPSILQCDFGDLRGELSSLMDGGVPGIHLDVMDGNFVPNLSFGMPVVAGIRRYCDLPLDVHLMISHPQEYVDSFCEAGADAITFHIEAVPDAPPLLRRIRDRGLASGIVLNPDTPVSAIEACVGLCDIVLVMSVQAGFGGQSFRSVALEKLRESRDVFGADVLLEIDGGVNVSTIGDCVRNGAELLVVGSAITGQPDYPAAIATLRRTLENETDR